MLSGAGNSEIIQLSGTLRFNEFEGGFWSLELDAAIDGLGDHVVLAGWSPGGDEHQDGSHVRVRARTSPESIGFLMAGPQVDVLEVELA